MNSSNQQTIENIKNGELPVIIFGARSVGEALFYACREVEIKVECFCDNDINKTKDFICGTKVVHTSDLKKKYKDAIFLISAADIKDVVDQLNCLGYSKWHPSAILLRDFNIYQHKFTVPIDFVEYTVATCLLCHDNYLTPNKLFLRSVDIIITERCSQKCRDCSNLMQYYQKPVNSGINELIQSIDAFCNIIDEVNEFRVIGGEPFMNPDFDLIVKKLIDEPKVKKIVIYTNGTIVPKDEKLECLKNNKALLIITDYGHSKNLKILTAKLLNNKIAFYVQKAGGWTDCSKIKKHNRNIEKQKEIFGNCCAKNTITLSNNFLFRCPFSANAARLKAVPDFKGDYINIFGGNIEGIKKLIKSYLLEKEFLLTCDFCNGRSFGDPEITPAIQTKRPLEYERYLEKNLTQKI